MVYAKTSYIPQTALDVKKTLESTGTVTKTSHLLDTIEH